MLCSHVYSREVLLNPENEGLSTLRIHWCAFLTEAHSGDKGDDNVSGRWGCGLLGWTRSVWGSAVGLLWLRYLFNSEEVGGQAIEEESESVSWASDTQSFPSWWWNSIPALYPLKDIWVCPGSLHVFSGPGEELLVCQICCWWVLDSASAVICH